jgi:hypothetical protein
MNVVNGEPFLRYQLDSIYPHAHEIIIVEGAYTRYRHASTPDGHSLDNTVTIIRNFPDPQNKIKLIQREGFWDDLCDMCNAFLPYVTGDVIWQVDADEFYMPQTHEFVAEIMTTNLSLDRICFKTHDFYFSLNYELAGGIEDSGLSDIKRVHRYTPGDIWVTQRPPTLGNTLGAPKALRETISGEEMALLGHFLYHPTVLFRHQFYNKFRYYRQLWPSIPQSDDWLNGIWNRFDNSINIMGLGTLATWIKPFTGPPAPQALKNLVSDVEAGHYPGYELRQNTDIESYLKSWQYPFDTFAGRCLNLIQIETRWQRIPMILAAMVYVCFFAIFNYRREPGKFCWQGLCATLERFVKKLTGHSRENPL